MIWLLRIFSAFRNLESELARATEDKIRLQDRLDAAESERSRVWSELQRSLENERQAYRMWQNENWQRQYGTVPHPDAPHLPSSAAHVQEGGPIPVKRTFGTAVVANQRRKFAQELHARLKMPAVSTPEVEPVA